MLIEKNEINGDFLGESIISTAKLQAKCRNLNSSRVMLKKGSTYVKSVTKLHKGCDQGHNQENIFNFRLQIIFFLSYK